MKDNSEMTKEELIALGWVKRPSDKMQEKAEKQLTAVEYLINELSDIIGPIEATISGELLLAGAIKRAKEMEVKQRGYSEEDVREMLFMALCETQEECCTTHTKDSIVRKVLKTFEQLRLAEQLENEIDNL